MTKLPVVSGKQVIKALRKIGFVVMRQRGSHVLLRRVSAGRIIKLTVPLHKELKRGTLKRILDTAEISVKKFMDLLRDC